MCARVGGLHVVGQQFTDALHPVAHGVAVDAQTCCGSLDLSVVSQEGRKGTEQFVALLSQRIQRSCEHAEFGVPATAEQHPVDIELTELGELAALLGERRDARLLHALVDLGNADWLAGAAVQRFARFLGESCQHLGDAPPARGGDHDHHLVADRSHQVGARRLPVLGPGLVRRPVPGPRRRRHHHHLTLGVESEVPQHAAVDSTGAA